MLRFFKNAEPDAKQMAKRLFEKVSTLTGQGHEARRARLRMGMLVRAFADKTFIDGAQQAAQWQAAVAQALVQGLEKPALPQASAYQQIKSGGKNLWVYLPQAHAQAFFDLGIRYQCMQINAHQAIAQAQVLMDRLCMQALQIEMPSEVLQFLRQELQDAAAQAAGDASPALTPETTDPVPLAQDSARGESCRPQSEVLAR